MIDYLFFGAHPDDVELGAGGLIIKSVKEGKKVAIVDLTEGELGSRGSVMQRYKEAEDANKVLGIQHRNNLKLADGFFKKDEKSILKIIEMIRYYQPNIIFANAPQDRHPDHSRACELVVEACFLSGLVKIETHRDGKEQKIWKPQHIFHYVQDKFLTPQIVVDITNFFDDKMKSILCYESQFFNTNYKQKEEETYISGKWFLDALKHRAGEMGHFIGVPFGEGFISSKPLGLKTFDALL